MEISFTLTLVSKQTTVSRTRAVSEPFVIVHFAWLVLVVVVGSPVLEHVWLDVGTLSIITCAVSDLVGRPS